MLHKWLRNISIPLTGLNLLFSSCSYHWGSEEKTLSIPYVSGDVDGALTAELARAFATTTDAHLLSEGGQYRLEVALVETQNEVIGYRLDPQKIRDHVKKELVADQNRKTIYVDISLFEQSSEKPIFGPHRLFARTEYDYQDGDSYQDLTFQLKGTTVKVLPFSLGQLESSETAQEGASKPLYRQLAQKTVDLIAAHW